MAEQTRSSCVVTGGARGIGRAIAERMVQRGHRVVVTDMSPDVVEVAGEIGAVEGIVQDVRDRASHADVASAAAGHGRLVAWFNNAGVGDDGALAELSDESVQRLVDVNLLGTTWGMRAALAEFGQGDGDIVNVASLSGLGPVPGLSTYAATKAAVVSLSMSVDAETPPSVRVHAVCPDGVDTEMVRTMKEDGMAKALIHSGGRILTVDEVADAAVALVGSRRIVQTLPGWRGGLMRAASLTPGVSERAMGLFAAQGARAVRRRTPDPR